VVDGEVDAKPDPELSGYGAFWDELRERAGGSVRSTLGAAEASLVIGLGRAEGSKRGLVTICLRAENEFWVFSIAAARCSH
jgi:hypothetical protein